MIVGLTNCHKLPAPSSPPSSTCEEYIRKEVRCIWGEYYKARNLP